MKHVLKFFFLAFSLSAILMACDKVVDLPVYKNGHAPVLSSTVSAIAVAPSDSNNNVVTFLWSDTKYATDPNTIKYVVEIDSTGRNFSKAVSRVVTGFYGVSYTGKQINDILVGFGFSFGVAYDMDVRVTSSYGNNNEAYRSNTITMKMTPYVVPPKVNIPASGALFLVGSATGGGWNNPVPVLTQQFIKLDPLTYQGTFYLSGGGQYLMLPVNGDWTHKYSVANNSISGLSAGGDFGYDLNDNFPGPAVSGLYTVTVDFQHGKFTVTPVKTYALMYVPGDYQGWNPSAAPSVASPSSNGNFEGYINIPSGGSYEFKLTSEPDWNGTNYGDGGGGTLSTSGGNLTVPAGGYYKINASTADNTWSAKATTWSMIGSFTSWGSDIDMTYDDINKTWSGTVDLAADGEFKFRANHDWGLNYGDTGADGTLNEGGDNLKITAGTRKITLDLHNSGYYYYKIE
ncbi:MAG TPA: SusE domain-containing protein [Panacibacter sp.]|nr:SusE domain-containing protein [Panacibacter sp.]